MMSLANYNKSEEAIARDVQLAIVDSGTLVDNKLKLHGKYANEMTQDNTVKIEKDGQVYTVTITKD